MTTTRPRTMKRKNTSRPKDQKIQRWIDLLAALLRRHYGATFEQLRDDVPAYAAATDFRLYLFDTQGCVHPIGHPLPGLGAGLSRFVGPFGSRSGQVG